MRIHLERKIDQRQLMVTPIPASRPGTQTTSLGPGPCPLQRSSNWTERD